MGWLGAKVLVWCRERGWVGLEWSQIATLALVLLAFALADTAEGSGFIATWVAGVTFGRATKDRVPGTAIFAEDLGSLLALLSFLGFGAILLGPLIDDVTWQAVAYAALSLTVVRMLPVALSLLGTGLARPTLVLAGWFGPRGLASIVFGLLVAGEGAPRRIRHLASGIRDRRVERGAPRCHGGLGSAPLRCVVRGGDGCRPPPAGG